MFRPEMTWPMVIVLSFFAALAAAAGAVLRPRLRVALAVTAVAAGAACCVLIHMLFAGAVVIFDPTGTLRSASIVRGDTPEELRSVVNGYYYGEPHGDASLHLTFADGHSEDRCYLTPGMPVWVEIGLPPSC